MTGLGMSSAGNIPAVDHVQVVALYDPDTGRIHHVHMVTTLAGGSRTDEADVITEARARAARRHDGADKLAVALSNDAQHALQPHAIDPASMTFVRLEVSAPAATAT